MKYENRIVMLLDILGFKEIIAKTFKKDLDNEDKIDILYNNLNDMYFEVAWLKSAQEDSRQVTQFSDSIVVSFLINDTQEVFTFFTNIHFLIVELVKKGILCRGAVAYGKLIHDEKVIFGPALIDAYITETTAALYPRVILDNSVIDILKNHHKLNNDSKQMDLFYDNLLTKDFDEKLYFDYFSAKSIFNKYSKNIAKYVIEYITDYLPQLEKIIKIGLKYQQPDLKVKYGWMKNKYNMNLQDLKTNISVYGIKEDSIINRLKKQRKLQ